MNFTPKNSATVAGLAQFFLVLFMYYLMLFIAIFVLNGGSVASSKIVRKLHRGLNF